MAIARGTTSWSVEALRPTRQGTQWKGKGVGSIGHFGCFSFQQGRHDCWPKRDHSDQDEDLAAEVFSHHKHRSYCNGRYRVHKVSTNFFV